MAFADPILSTVKNRLRFLREIEEKIRRVPLAIVQIFFAFSSQFALNSKSLNRLGIQKFRIKLAERALERRRTSGKFDAIAAQDLVSSNRLETLKELGILRVNDALPKLHYESCQTIVSRILADDINHKKFVKAGAEYREVVVSEADKGLHDFLCNEFWLGDVVKTYLAKSDLTQEWRIKLIRDYDGTFDNNTLWHADTFFSTLKAFIYLNDVPKEQDVYEYVETTHLLTDEILDLHYRYSRDECRQPWPTIQEVDALKKKRFREDISANTLVLSDTRGLHRRHPKETPNSEWRATLFCSFRSTPFFS